MHKSYKNMEPEKQKELVAGITKMITLAMPERAVEEGGRIKTRILKKADELGDTIRRKTSEIKIRKLPENKNEI